MNTRYLLCAVVLAGAALLPACSSAPAICSALDDGEPALLAARTAYGDAGGDTATAQRMLRQGEQEVRASCPEHNDAAAEMGAMAEVVGLAP